MTNLNQIKSLIAQNYPISDSFFEAQLSQYGVIASDEYSGGRNFDYAVFMSCFFILSGAVKIQESGYSVELNKDGFEMLMQMYADKWGWAIPNKDLGLIKNATNGW